VIFETPDGGSIGRRQAMQSSLPLQQEMYYPGQQPGSVLYDDYDEYHASHRPTRIDNANDGFYRGEIQLDSMGRGHPRGSYGDQETRFM